MSASDVHHQYSSSVSPFQANTGMPRGFSIVPPVSGRPTTTAAAAWSCVEKMLQLTQRTSAPRMLQGLDEHGRLHGHVQRAHDARALQRLVLAVLLAARP